MSSNDISISDFHYDEKKTDFVLVEAIPERRGVVIKHVEYAITCKKFNAQVKRRFKDFLVFRELLLLRFSYRIIPKLPPKKINIVIDSVLTEERRRWLQRFLNFIVRHPSMGSDVLVEHFLTNQERDVYLTMKNEFSSLPDEFFVNPLSLKAQNFVKDQFTHDYKKHRENIQQVLVAISKFYDIFYRRLKRFEAESADLREMDKLLKDLAGSSRTPTSPGAERDFTNPGKCILAGVPKWLGDKENEMLHTMRGNVAQVAPHLSTVSSVVAERNRSEETCVIDKLNLLIDIISGYQELCQRHEKGVTSEHHRAIRQLNNLKRLTSPSASPNVSNSPQNLEAIEKTVHQHEAEIATIEQRNAFALLCVQEETRLVYLHFVILNEIIGSWASSNSRHLGEVTTIWRDILTCVCLDSSDQQPTTCNRR